MAVEGYQDIDKFYANQNATLDKMQQAMDENTDKSVQLQTERLARQKEDIDRDTIQQNRALYQDYRKTSNPFGVQAENLASQGLGNSGYAETTMSRLYNTYQNNITATLNTARQLKADVDFAINEAIRTGDITKGENAIKVYAQRMQLNAEEFDARNNREQLLYNRNYQAQRDKIEDGWRQKEWKRQLGLDKEAKKQQKFENEMTKKQFELSKKSLATSSRRRSSGSGSKKKYNDDLAINTDDNINTGNNGSIPRKKDGSEYTPKEIIANIKNIQGDNVKNPIMDGITGKTFKSVDALLNYYGYINKK